MNKLLRFIWACLGLLACLGAQAAENFVVIGHASVPKVDVTTLQRLYTGRAIEVAGAAVTVVNAAPGSPTRDRFLSLVLNMDNERYVAYWTVRRHVGKGVPPREFRTSAELADYVLATPGAVGYIPSAEVRQGMNVVYRP